MDDYCAQAQEFKRGLEEIQLRTAGNHVEHYDVMGDLTGFQDLLNIKVTAIHNTRGYLRDHLAEAYVHNMFQQNIQSLTASLFAAERNMHHASSSILRTVLESFSKMFYASFFPNDAPYMIMKDVIGGKRDDSAKRQLLDEYKGATTIEQLRSVDNADILQHTKKGYYFDWYNKRIFCPQTQEAAASVYSALSKSVHPAAFRVDPEYSPEHMDSMLRQVEYMTFYNIRVVS